VHSAGEAYALAAEISKRPELSLTGLMFYDAQIAGLPDSSLVVRAVKSLSAWNCSIGGPRSSRR
jgi:D-serine deaminase-like pyridoxal phosphate-dependent protein